MISPFSPPCPPYNHSRTLSTNYPHQNSPLVHLLLSSWMIILLMIYLKALSPRNTQNPSPQLELPPLEHFFLITMISPLQITQTQIHSIPHLLLYPQKQALQWPQSLTFLQQWP